MSSKPLAKSCRKPECKAQGRSVTGLCADCFEKTVCPTSSKFTFTLLPDLNIMKAVRAVLTEANKNPMLTFKDKDWHRRVEEDDFYQMFLEYCSEYEYLLKEAEEYSKKDHDLDKDGQHQEEESRLYQILQEYTKELVSLLDQEEFLKEHYYTSKEAIYLLEEKIDFYDMVKECCEEFGGFLIQKEKLVKKINNSIFNFLTMENVLLRKASQNLILGIQENDWHRRKEENAFYNAVSAYCDSLRFLLEQEEHFLRNYYDLKLNFMKFVKLVLIEVHQDQALTFTDEDGHCRAEEDEFYLMVLEYCIEFWSVSKQEEEFLKKLYDSTVEDKKFKLRQENEDPEIRMKRNKEERDLLIKQNKLYAAEFKESTDIYEKQEILKKKEEILERIASQGYYKVDATKIKDTCEKIKPKKGHCSRKYKKKRR